MKQQRLVRFASISLVAAVLAACAGAAPAPAPAPAPAATTKVEAPKPAAPVKLRLASWQWEDAAYKDFWNGTTEDFAKKNPNVSFEKFSFPIDNLWDKLNTELAAGTPPDLIEVTGFNVFQYMDQGVLAPLNDCFAGTDIPDKIQDQKTYAAKDGKMYALNLSARTLQLYVNQKLFDEAGVKVPTNFNELRDAAKKLTVKAKDQYGLVLVTVAHSRLYEGALVFIAGYGGHYSKNGKPALNSPEVIKGVTFFKELFDAGTIPQGVKDAASQYAWFNQGKAAMSIDGAWYWAVLEKDGPAVLPNTKIYPIPTDTQAATGGVNNLIGIAAKSPNYKVACEYIKSLTAPQWAQLWVEKSRTIFPMQGSVSDSFVKANPWFDVFGKELKKAVPVAPPGLEIYYNDVQKVINTKLVEVLYNNKPVEQAMNEAQAEIEKVIKK